MPDNTINYSGDKKPARPQVSTLGTPVPERIELIAVRTPVIVLPDSLWRW